MTKYPDQTEIDRITEIIYDSAIDASHWTDVAQRMRAAFGVMAVNITGYDPSASRGFIINSGQDPSMIDEYVARFAKLDPMRPLVEKLQLGRAVMSDTLMPNSDFVRTEYYADWLRPQGIARAAVGMTARGKSLLGGVVLSFGERQEPHGAAGLAALGHILPHIGRAVRTTVRLASQEAQTADVERLLGQLREGAMLLDAQGMIVYANRASELILASSDGLTTRGRELCALAVNDQRSLRQAFATAAAGGSASVAVSRPSGRPHFALSAQPSGPRLAFDNPVRVIRRAAILLFIVDPVSHDGARVRQVLASLYGLTKTEIAVATAISAGKGAGDVAAALAVRVATVRWHLQRVFEKTGTSRQAELTRLVDRLGAITGPGSDAACGGWPPM